MATKIYVYTLFNYARVSNRSHTRLPTERRFSPIVRLSLTPPPKHPADNASKASPLCHLHKKSSQKNTKKPLQEFLKRQYFEPKTRLELVTYALRMRRSTN